MKSGVNGLPGESLSYVNHGTMIDMYTKISNDWMSTQRYRRSPYSINWICAICANTSWKVFGSKLVQVIFVRKNNAA